jgi:hypothetical protein
MKDLRCVLGRHDFEPLAPSRAHESQWCRRCDRRRARAEDGRPLERPVFNEPFRDAQPGT